MRLRWLGNVKRRDENSILRRAMELEVEGRRPVCRPKKTLSKVTSGRRHKVKHHRRYGREYKTVEAAHITSAPRHGRLGTINKEDDDENKF